MGRLIDADILIAELKESALHHCNNPREDSLLQRDRVIVRAQPTIEAISKAEYESRLKADLKAILVELQLEMEELEEEADIGKVVMIGAMDRLIQQKIDLLQKQTTDNCDNCFNGTTKGGCAVKELMKNKDCKYYMPRENQ